MSSRRAGHALVASVAVAGLLLSAISLALMVLRRPNRTTNRVGSDEVTLSERLELLAMRMAELERAPIADASSAPVPPQRESGPPDVNEVQTQLDALEADLAAVAAQLDAWIRREPVTADEHVAAAADERLIGTRLLSESIASLQATLQDGSIELEARLDALETLVRLPSEADPLGPVMPTLRGLLDSLEGRALTKLLRAVGETLDPRVCMALLDRRDRETDARLRRDLLHALRKAASLPIVRDALETATKQEDMEGVAARQILRRIQIGSVK